MNVYYKGNPVAIGGGSGSSPLEGKKLLFIGDSNLQYMGANLTAKLIEYTGCASVTNIARAGATWETTAGTDTVDTASAVGQTNMFLAPYKSMDICTEYDVICIMMGTNGGSDMGSLSGSNASDVTNIAGAMHYCLSNILWYCRESTVCGIIPPQAEWYKERPAKFEVIKEVYDWYSVPTYDFFTQGQVVWNSKVLGGLNVGGNKPGYLGDSVHLGANGKEQFYRKIARFLENQV